MDIEAFKAYLKKNKKSAETIQGYVKSLEFFVNFLKSNRQINSPDKASPIDLEEFVNWRTALSENVYMRCWGIRMYYEFKKLDRMEKIVREWF